MSNILERPKHPGGRPTKYRPEYCDLVIEAAEEGLSLTAFAGMIGVDRDTIFEWGNVHPEFSLAVRKHKAVRTLALERGLLGATGKEGARVTARIFALKNAAPEEWKDKQPEERHEHVLRIVGGLPD